MLKAISQIFFEASGKVTSFAANAFQKYNYHLLAYNVNSISATSVFMGGERETAERIVESLKFLSRSQLLSMLKQKNVAILSCAGQADSLFRICSSLTPQDFSDVASDSNILGWLTEAGQGSNILDFIANLPSDKRFRALSAQTTMAALIENGHIQGALYIAETLPIQQKNEVLSNRLTLKALKKMQIHIH